MVYSYDDGVQVVQVVSVPAVNLRTQRQPRTLRLAGGCQARVLKILSQVVGVVGLGRVRGKEVVRERGEGGEEREKQRLLRSSSQSWFTSWHWQMA